MAARVLRGSLKDALFNKVELRCGVGPRRYSTASEAAARAAPRIPHSSKKVMNISSSNTPGLCKLQGRKQLKELVKKVQAARDEMQWAEEGPPPLVVKIAPDLSKEDIEDSSCCSCSPFGWIDPVSSHPLAGESGGLSGKPLFDMSTSILKEMYILTQGKIPLIGCGGVSKYLPKCSGEDAYKKIRAGATLVQLYTAFTYDGPSLIPQIKAELAECLEQDGFESVQEAVGADSHNIYV
ncbi:hypothetical protein C4D60_Mb01t18260 [Musa balbisiana]|uniref:Dihydroorotate dehydrogenase catalytic domain-containing protein n=1 Tax=Musa balbisiana TaxID=52838 RepID=A0A4S8JNG1_MUSBA|nr:hypothetical protein C4D60_Mb01t18260 [Musa balbisiana]